MSRVGGGYPMPREPSEIVPRLRRSAVRRAAQAIAFRIAIANRQFERVHQPAERAAIKQTQRPTNVPRQPALTRSRDDVIRQRVRRDVEARNRPGGLRNGLLLPVHLAERVPVAGDEPNEKPNRHRRRRPENDITKARKERSVQPVWRELGLRLPRLRFVNDEILVLQDLCDLPTNLRSLLL